MRELRSASASDPGLGNASKRVECGRRSPTGSATRASIDGTPGWDWWKSLTVSTNNAPQAMLGTTVSHIDAVSHDMPLSVSSGPANEVMEKPTPRKPISRPVANPRLFLGNHKEAWVASDAFITPPQQPRSRRSTSMPV